MSMFHISFLIPRESLSLEYVVVGGCVLVLQGLSGTGKGTTVAKLQAALPSCVSWSNGNVFRSLTLLAVTHCEQAGVAFGHAHGRLRGGETSR